MYAMEYTKQERAAQAAIAIVVHLALVYVFATAIGVVPSPLSPSDLKWVDVPVPETKPLPIDPRPAGPSVATGEFRVVVPDVVINVEDGQPPVGLTTAIGDAGGTEVVEEAITGARILRSEEPNYPLVSRAREEQGTVLVKVMISPYGVAGEVQLEKSSGYPRLDDAAIKSVRGWKFTPAHRGSQAIAAWVTVPVTFQLTGRRR